MARTGRPVRHIEPTRPFAKFATDLVGLRAAAGLTVNQVARLSGYSAAVISSAADGKRMPTDSVLECYVKACGGNVAEWMERRTAEITRHQANQAAAAPEPSDGLPHSAPTTRYFGQGRRTSTPISRDVNDPSMIQTLEQFTAALNLLRADRTYRDLERLSAARWGSRLSKSTVSDMLHAKTVPNVDVLEAYLRACDVPPEDMRAWMTARDRIREPRLPAGVVRVRNVRPRSLGVPERPLAEAVMPGTVVDDLPPYVPREADGELRAALVDAAEHGGLVLVIGGAGVGKTRAAFEAARFLLPTWRLVRPADAEQLRALAGSRLSQTLIWLDDLTTVDLDSVAIRRLVAAGCPVIATMRVEDYQRWLLPSAPGQDGPQGRDRDFLGLATVVHIPAELTPMELEQADRSDPRIVAATSSGPAGEVIRTLAAGSDLVRMWNTAPPLVKAVITAALDARRMGVKKPITADLLRASVPGYLDAVSRVLLAESAWLDHALDYATNRVRDVLAAMTPVADLAGEVIGYITSDYLASYAARKGGVPPDSAWTAYAVHLADSNDLYAVAVSAHERSLLGHAESLYRAAAVAGLGAARAALIDLLVAQARDEEADRVRLLGLNPDGTTRKS